MAARGHVPPGLGGRAVQAAGLMRHGHQPLDPLPPAELLQTKITSQAGEIQQLAEDNRILAASHVLLRQDLIAAQQEVERLQAHIRSIQTESDIQIRVLLDKIGKMESNIRAGENVKKDLRQAHMEAQSLVKASQELTTQIQEASHELKKVRADVKSLPDLHMELQNLRNEHKSLRATFEYQKGLNIEKVEQLRRMEQNLIGMAREIEKLQAQVLNAETRACAPNTGSVGGGYMGPVPPCPAPIHSGGLYVDAYGRSHSHSSIGPEGMIPYSMGNSAAVSGTASVVREGTAGPRDPSQGHL